MHGYVLILPVMQFFGNILVFNVWLPEENEGDGEEGGYWYPTFPGSYFSQRERSLKQ